MKVKKKLDVSAKSSLQEAVKNVKEILKVKKVKQESSNEIDKKPEVEKKLAQVKKVEKPKKSPRGLVYVGHIPHGFYEDQMKGYFTQFGTVTRVRLKRSPKTGRSCGYGYVEFLRPAVAKIAAETMNNYLMNGRLVKATYVPPEEQHGRYFRGKQITRFSYPALTRRRKFKAVLKRKESDEKQQIKEKKCLAKLLYMEEALKEKGINLKFDIPPAKKSAALGAVKNDSDEDSEEEVKVIPKQKEKSQAKTKQVQPTKKKVLVPWLSELKGPMAKKRAAEAESQKTDAEEVIIPSQKRAKQATLKSAVKSGEAPKGKKAEAKLPKKVQAPTVQKEKQPSKSVEKKELKKGTGVKSSKATKVEKKGKVTSEVSNESKVSTRSSSKITPAVKQKPLVELPSKGKKQKTIKRK